MSRALPRLGAIITALALGAGVRFLMALFSGASSGQLIATLPVGPEGASSQLAGGVSLNVPAGAVGEPTTISLHKRPVDQDVTFVSPSGGDPLQFPAGELSVYQLTPTDTDLQQPIQLTLPLPEGQPTVVFITADGEARTLPNYVGGETVELSISSFDFSDPNAITIAP